ncbi:MAG TPA: hypothetical protein VI759_08370 [Dehalococcoidia bacterium]|nr:hypothetical protein [Dehalococcoidia bacterium]
MANQQNQELNPVAKAVLDALEEAGQELPASDDHSRSQLEYGSAEDTILACADPKALGDYSLRPVIEALVEYYKAHSEEIGEYAPEDWAVAQVLGEMLPNLCDRVLAHAPWLERRKLRRVMALDSPDLSVGNHLMAIADTCYRILTNHPSRWSDGQRIYLLELIAQVDELARYHFSQRLEYRLSDGAQAID